MKLVLNRNSYGAQSESFGPSLRIGTTGVVLMSQWVFNHCRVAASQMCWVCRLLMLLVTPSLYVYSRTGQCGQRRTAVRWCGVEFGYRTRGGAPEDTYSYTSAGWQLTVKWLPIGHRRILPWGVR